jgi:hypothetical protein
LTTLWSESDLRQLQLALTQKFYAVAQLSGSLKLKTLCRAAHLYFQPDDCRLNVFGRVIFNLFPLRRRLEVILSLIHI